jgi:hypothetical protein
MQGTAPSLLVNRRQSRLYSRRVDPPRLLPQRIDLQDKEDGPRPRVSGTQDPAQPPSITGDERVIFYEDNVVDEAPESPAAPAVSTAALRLGLASCVSYF